MIEAKAVKVLQKEAALEFLDRLAAGMAQMFGLSCEVVIHDMNNKESSIVSIYHGEVTKRQVGDSLSILGVQKLDEFFEGRDFVNSQGKTKEGRLLKSSTFHLRGEDYHYAIGINYDYTHLELAKSVLAELTAVGAPIEEELHASAPTLDSIFEACLQRLGKPVALLNREDRLQMIALLSEQGAFQFAKSIPAIAEKLNVSRFTIYKYLKERS